MKIGMGGSGFFRLGDWGRRSDVPAETRRLSGSGVDVDLYLSTDRRTMTKVWMDYTTIAGAKNRQASTRIQPRCPPGQNVAL